MPYILSREDAAAIVSAPNPRYPTGMRNRVALQLMYRCGLRVSEVCNLTLPSVRIQPEGGGYVFVQQGKGGKDRTVPLDADTARWIHRWITTFRPPSEWLLPTMKGTQVNDRYYRALLERLSKRLDIYLYYGTERKPVHPHALRHCFCTERLEDGFSIVEVMHMAGHANISTTQIYTHIRPTALAAKMLELPPVGV